MTPDFMFSVLSTGILVFWLFLFVLPNWRGTQLLVHSVAAPIGLGVAYAWFLTAGLGTEGGSLSSLEGVQAFFANPNAALAGWIHYLVFDLFIGAWEVRDARRRGISHIFVIPCLFFTLMAGPIGLLAYLMVRLAAGRGGWELEEDRVD